MLSDGKQGEQTVVGCVLSFSIFAFWADISLHWYHWCLEPMMFEAVLITRWNLWCFLSECFLSSLALLKTKIEFNLNGLNVVQNKTQMLTPLKSLKYAGYLNHKHHLSVPSHWLCIIPIHTIDLLRGRDVALSHAHHDLWPLRVPRILLSCHRHRIPKSSMKIWYILIHRFRICPTAKDTSLSHAIALGVTFLHSYKHTHTL